jgi:membrane peptidoglycan carboxypeptidase
VANGVSQILKAVITKGTGAGNELAGGRPAAGKTGTAGNSTPAGGTNETWFVGSTPQLTTAVWVGTPVDPSNAARMENLTIGGTFYPRELFGATIAAPVWKQIMDRTSVGLPILDFGSPGTKVQSGDLVPIPGVAGMTVADATAALTAAAFKPVVGLAVASSLPVGTVVGTEPAGQALRGTTVVILPSAGAPATKVAPQPTKAGPNTRGKLPKCRPGGPKLCR